MLMFLILKYNNQGSKVKDKLKKHELNKLKKRRFTFVNAADCELIRTTNS